jgi:hypothetical protein
MEEELGRALSKDIAIGFVVGGCVWVHVVAWKGLSLWDRDNYSSCDEEEEVHSCCWGVWLVGAMKEGIGFRYEMKEREGERLVYQSKNANSAQNVSMRME